MGKIEDEVQGNPENRTSVAYFCMAEKIANTPAEVTKFNTFAKEALGARTLSVLLKNISSFIEEWDRQPRIVKKAISQDEKYEMYNKLLVDVAVIEWPETDSNQLHRSQFVELVEALGVIRKWAGLEVDTWFKGGMVGPDGTAAELFISAIVEAKQPAWAREILRHYPGVAWKVNNKPGFLNMLMGKEMDVMRDTSALNATEWKTLIDEMLNLHIEYGPGFGTVMYHLNLEPIYSTDIIVQLANVGAHKWQSSVEQMEKIKKIYSTEKRIDNEMTARVERFISQQCRAHLSSKVKVEGFTLDDPYTGGAKLKI